MADAGDASSQPIPMAPARRRGQAIGTTGIPVCPADRADDLLIGLGNTLRGDDGVGPHLAQWAQRHWPGLNVRSAQQLTPELSLELAMASRVLFLDAWQGPGAGRQEECHPRLRELTLPLSGNPGLPEAGAFSHVLDPLQLLAITVLLHGRAPRAWLLLIPAFRCEHGEGLSAEQRRLVPQAELLLRGWCDETWAELRAAEPHA